MDEIFWKLFFFWEADESRVKHAEHTKSSLLRPGAALYTSEMKGSFRREGGRNRKWLRGAPVAFAYLSCELSWEGGDSPFDTFPSLRFFPFACSPIQKCTLLPSLSLSFVKDAHNLFPRAAAAKERGRYIIIIPKRGERKNREKEKEEGKRGAKMLFYSCSYSFSFHIFEWMAMFTKNWKIGRNENNRTWT